MALLLSLIASQIIFLLQRLTDSNSDAVLNELLQFVEYGSEGSIFLLRTCLDHVNFDKGDVHKMQLRPNLLGAILRYLLDRPNFSTVFCKSLRGIMINEKFLGDFCDALHLSVFEKIALGLALADAENLEMRTSGQNFCMGQIEKLRENPASVDSAEQIQNIIMLFYRSEGLAKHVDSFMQMLSLMDPKESTPLILSPLLSVSLMETTRNLDIFHGCSENEFDAIVAEMESETSMTDIMRELGYGCTVNCSHCIEVLTSFSPLTEVTLSRILSSMARTYTGLEENQSFDSAFCSAIGSTATSELSHFCSWNVDVLVDSIKQLVAAAPEIFTFAHSVEKLVYDEVRGHGSANHAWLSLDLLEVLCQLAERGHASTVRAMLEFPLKHYPETSLLGIAQINTSYNFLQCDGSSTVSPLIVANSMRRMILNLWHSNSKLVVRGFIEMARTDQGNILRILDICQELKECLKFLKEISFDAADQASTNLFQHSGPIVNADSETSSTISKVLQANVKQITSDHLAEELKRVQGGFLHVGPQLQHVDTSDPPASDGYADDIEAQANSHFHQMFSGEVPIDAMIQMLAHFKESSEKREHSIADCMIQNLFDKYKFFPKYPENQLMIAAVLFGSLIKHWLVTHLTLGIALRYVLDALPKPTDSKIFAFGAKALEQFLDRLIELPQYCNHILQISHLRGTYPELVSFIDHALARISSGHLESNRVHGASSDPLDGSTSSTSENMEVADSSWQLLGSRNTQPSQKLSSALQQREHQVFLGDRHRTTTTSNSSTKPLLTPSVHPSYTSTSAVASSQNSTISQPSQNATSVSAAALSSGFLYSSMGITSTSMRRHHSYNTGFGSAPNIETLIAAAERSDAPIEAPASDVLDKILFMINNISTLNIDAKAKEFSEILSEQYYPWFAQYMVMKRASIEPNFHDLYLNFLDKVNSKALNKEIVKASYENCKVLLRSELIKSSSEERSLLKNLGSWLGKFTIGKNQVLRAGEIDPKSLIIEAYEKGLMIAVIPFTSKILELCQSSIAYRPPNPWTMAILSLLAEIYALPNLKMNLKFDIEVLFKNLGIDMKILKPTSILKDHVRDLEGNPDFSNKDIGASQMQAVTEINSGIIPALNRVDRQPEIVNSSHPCGHFKVLSQYAGGLSLASAPLMEDEKIAALCLSDRLPSGQVPPSQSPYSLGQLPSPIPNIGIHINLNQKLSALGLHYFQSVIPNAIERAVKEVMSSVVQRSVAIAIRTTKELVLKDYAMEPEETRIYNAAHLMVASLAGSLAHVICKEPLRASISSQLTISLQSLTIPNEVIEHDMPFIMNDNLDVGCMVIAHAATEKALQTIDGEIAQPLSLRKKHREGVGPSFFDASVYAQASMGALWEALRPLPGHLSHSNQRVYEDFIRFPWKNQPGQSSNGKKDRTKQPRENKGIDHSMTSKEDHTTVAVAVVDPAGFHEQVSSLFREWYQIYELHGTNDRACTHFITQLQQSGFLNGDDMSDRFFRLLMDISVAHCLSSEMHSPHLVPNLSFLAIDIYAKLVSLILKYCVVEHGPSRLLLWPKILSVTVRVIQRDAEEKKGSFNPRPFFRLFINWLFDLATQDPIQDEATFQVLIAFANAFHALQPLKVPAFSFAWLELVSHRSFMPKLLAHNAPKGWIYVQHLLVDLFKFMEPYLRNAKLSEPIHVLYKGTLRVLLVLLHDFPEFLSNYHFTFCDVIPSSCIQMRNVILSAFTRNMRLPDPSTPNLKIDLLPDINIPPLIFSEVDAALKAKQMKSDVDEYLKIRHQGSSFLSDIKQRLLLPQNETAQAGTCYNVPLINSLVLYVGMQAVQQLRTKAPPPHAQKMTHNGPMELYLMGPALDIFQTLIMDLDTEGRYILLHAIANQLRYPNNHTHLFSFVVLYLFNEATQEIIQEQITRVLLERLIVNKPHPWGILITFIELIKNPRYNFWNRSFTRCAPEIENLIQSVVKSCGGSKHVDESISSERISDNCTKVFKLWYL